MKPAGSSAVMAVRRMPPDRLEFFPTPPWATRAGAELILDIDVACSTVLEPACGEGHMATVLQESHLHVTGSDVWDYGKGYSVADFLDVHTRNFDDFDWIVTNPPFSVAADFAELGLMRARRGVALLVRTQFLEGAGRWQQLFGKHPPHTIAQFVERVPMVLGRWDPKASTATAYCWVIWRKVRPIHNTRFTWIPPGTRDRLWRADDIRRFSAITDAPLLEAAK